MRQLVCHGEVAEPLAAIREWPARLAILAVGLACALGFRSAFKRRNQLIAKSLFIPGGAEEARAPVTEAEGAVSGLSARLRKWALPRRAQNASRRLQRLTYETPTGIMAIERYLLLLRLSLVAGLIAPVLLQHDYFVEVLGRTGSYVSAAADLVQACNRAGADGSASFKVAGADTYMMLDILVVMLALLAGAVGPATVVTFSIAAAELWSRRSRPDTPGGRHAGAVRRYGVMAFFAALMVFIPFALSNALDSLAQQLRSAGAEQLLIVKGPKERPTQEGPKNGATKTESTKTGAGGSSKPQGAASTEPADASLIKRRYSYLPETFRVDSEVCAQLDGAFPADYQAGSVKFVPFVKKVKPVEKKEGANGNAARPGKGASEKQKPEKAAEDTESRALGNIVDPIEGGYLGKLYWFWGGLQLAFIYLVMFLTMFAGTVAIERAMKRRFAQREDALARTHARTPRNVRSAGPAPEATLAH